MTDETVPVDETVFGRILSKHKKWNVNQGTIQDHLLLVRKNLFPTLFPGKPYHFYWQAAIKNSGEALTDRKVDEHKWNVVFSGIGAGKGSDARTAFIRAVEKQLQKALKTFYPLPARVANPSDFKKLFGGKCVTFASRTETVPEAVTPNVARKIASIYDYGAKYKGHGPTTALGGGVLHAHVGNGDGVAFRWNGETLVIYAHGEKSDSAPAGTSGYKWEKL